VSGPRAAAVAGDVPGAVVRRAPRTFTREDLVEIHLPGAPPLIDALLRLLVSRGARPARPGEFTLRAFRNGRIDLVQAEAVERLIAAEDDADRRAALGQLGGEFSRRLRRIEEGLLDLCADVEAAIDFVDQDIEILDREEARRRTRELLEELRGLRSESALGRVRDGRPVVALLGPPNAGKSTLFNALTGKDALVSPVPGTTRDVLAADVDAGIPVRLLDAAGLSEPAGEIEAEACRRAREAVRAADLVLFVVDASDWEPAVPLEPREAPALLVLNKCDLDPGTEARGRFRISRSVCVSARTGRGLPELRAALAERLGTSESSGRYRIDLRQEEALEDAEAALDRASGSASGLGPEFAALDLRGALSALGAVSGRETDERLLDRVFSRFCLGK
jgi:tRNA modification GTPase